MRIVFIGLLNRKEVMLNVILLVVIWILIYLAIGVFCGALNKSYQNYMNHHLDREEVGFCIFIWPLAILIYSSLFLIDSACALGDKIYKPKK